MNDSVPTNSNYNGGTITATVNQTILQAREALQRRRRELQERRNQLSCSHDEEDRGVAFSSFVTLPSSTSSATSPTQVLYTVERGRALLAEADVHSEKLRRYTSFGDCEKSHSEILVNETSNKERGDMKSPCISTIIELDSGDDNKQEEEEAGEATGHIKLELITNISSHEEESNILTPEKRISNFDPSTMYSAKRAAIKKLKLDEAVANAEEHARLLTSFKALPLPGGVEVTHNIHAMTQSFQGKHNILGEMLMISPHHRRISQYEYQCQDESSSSIISGTRDDDFSSVRSMMSRDNNFFQSELKSDTDREAARQLFAERKMKKRQLLKSINKIILLECMSSANTREHTENSCNDFDESCDYVEDPSKLRLDIARLEAKLNQKKSLRDATLNDIVDIDVCALFDRFLPGDQNRYDITRQMIIDRMKAYAFHSFEGFNITLAEKSNPIYIQDHHHRVSVVQRQEEWLKKREQKLFCARMQLEADEMDGITGKPEISHTAQSWKKAKESHDEALKITTEVEDTKKREKAAKEKVVIEKMKAAEEERQLHEQSQPKPKLVKNIVSSEERLKRLERLSRPRKPFDDNHDGEHNTDSHASVHESRSGRSPEIKYLVHASPKKDKSAIKKKEKKLTPAQDWLVREVPEKVPNKIMGVSSYLEKKPDEFCGLQSFSDMSDKEFAKLVKRIKAGMRWLK